jgi:hypothetical protein
MPLSIKQRPLKRPCWIHPPSFRNPDVYIRAIIESLWKFLNKNFSRRDKNNPFPIRATTGTRFTGFCLREKILVRYGAVVEVKRHISDFAKKFFHFGLAV